MVKSALSTPGKCSNVDRYATVGCIGVWAGGGLQPPPPPQLLGNSVFWAAAVLFGGSSNGWMQRPMLS